jgi:hypothetical protein
MTWHFMSKKKPRKNILTNSCLYFFILEVYVYIFNIASNLQVNGTEQEKKY